MQLKRIASPSSNPSCPASRLPQPAAAVLTLTYSANVPPTVVCQPVFSWTRLQLDHSTNATHQIPAVLKAGRQCSAPGTRLYDRMYNDTYMTACPTPTEYLFFFSRFCDTLFVFSFSSYFYVLFSFPVISVFLLCYICIFLFSFFFSSFRFFVLAAVMTTLKSVVSICAARCVASTGESHSLLVVPN